jgi:hypothetical protein
LRDEWLPPVVSYPLFTTAFFGFSIYLLHRFAFAEYIIVLAYLSFVSKLSGKQRNDFLKICFKQKDYKIIRALENLAVALPFIAVLLYKLYFSAAAIIFTLGVILSHVSVLEKVSIVIPTPFSKKPFEFLVGFRNTFYIIAVAYILTIIAVRVDNFNLGAFSLLLVLLIAAGYNVNSENIFYVWQFALPPTRFLLYKLKISLWHSFLLCSPVFLILCMFYFKRAGVLFLVFIFGFAFLSTVILAKYSTYPKEIGLETGVLICLCLIAPPLMAIAIPYLFHKSRKKLSVILK